MTLKSTSNSNSLRSMSGPSNLASALTHTQRVKLLYKAILKLHRGLPLELKALGDQYARDEFRRHKTASNEYVQTFMAEWTSYAVSLAKQLGVKGPHVAKPIGASLNESDFDKFSEEQLQQLYDLYKEAKNPSVDFDEKQ